MTPANWDAEPDVPVDGLIDLHSHLLPGIDDGCRTLEESLQCVQRLIAAGFAGTVCTPHYWPEMFPGNRPDAIRRRVSELRAILDDRGIDYLLWTGAEVRLAHETVDDFEAYGVPTLGSGRAVLVDYWGLAWIDAADRAIDYLLERDYQPILAHPERMALDDDEWVALIDSMLQRGVWLQGNFNSIVGHEGPTATARLERLLGQDRIRILALDMHRPNSLATRLDGVEHFRNHFGADRLGDFVVTAPRDVLTHGESR